MSGAEAKVIDLQAFKARRDMVGDRKQGLQQAFKPSIGSSNPSSAPVDPDLSERIERIKSSIVRINQLMAELRSVSDKPKN